MTPAATEMKNILPSSITLLSGISSALVCEHVGSLPIGGKKTYRAVDTPARRAIYIYPRMTTRT